LAAAETGNLGQVQDAPLVETSTSDPISTEPQSSDKPRDEKGRFATQSSDRADGKNLNNEGDPVTSDAQPTSADQSAQQPPQLQRPTTWKKDYLPIWDKIATGQALTPEESRKLAEYNLQREKEFATGVSTYKSEAQNAKELQSALEPFMPALQQHNIKPTDWIRNLGQAHQMLATGSPEQKLQMFAKLAQDYGVPLAAIAPNAQGQLDPVIPQLMQEIQNLKQGVNTVTSWREQQEQAQIQNELAKYSDAEKYPHFESVRGKMAQLLESGLAQDLEDAYSQAIYLDPDARQAEFERQAQAQMQAAQQANKVAAVQKAKAAAVSTRTATPSGSVTPVDAKDRRSMIASGLDALSGGRV
jgi:hypothetical protein